MKNLLGFIFIITPTLALAGEGILGTKPSPGVVAAGPGQGTPGFFNLLQMLVAVGIVLAIIKFVMPKLVSKMGGKLTTKVAGGIQIEESANFAGGSLYVVTVRNKSLLLGVSGAQMNCLADLGPVNKPDPGPTFMELVEKSSGEIPMVSQVATDISGSQTDLYPSPGRVDLIENEYQPVENPKEILDRLTRLMG